jgi:hypothetical protein
MLELERLGVRIVSGRLGRGRGEGDDDDDDDDDDEDGGGNGSDGGESADATSAMMNASGGGGGGKKRSMGGGGIGGMNGGSSNMNTLGQLGGMMGGDSNLMMGGVRNIDTLACLFVCLLTFTSIMLLSVLSSHGNIYPLHPNIIDTVPFQQMGNNMGMGGMGVVSQRD